MFAVIETGGKQYKVKAGDVIRVEKLAVLPGESYTFGNVLALLDEGSSVFGSPYVAGASVKAAVLGDGRAKKVVIFKYKPKKSSKKKKGHRQPYTELRIESVNK